MIGDDRCLGAKFGDAVLYDGKGTEVLFVQWLSMRVRRRRAEGPVREDDERTVGASHSLDSIHDGPERGNRGGTGVVSVGTNTTQLLGSKTVGPVKGADRIYSEEDHFLVWHVRRVIRREIRDRGGELGKGCRTK